MMKTIIEAPSCSMANGVRRPRTLDNDALTERVIGAAIEVHKHLGPGLLESTYQDCLREELDEREIRYVSEPYLPIRYKRLTIEKAFRPDLIVENTLILELKHIEKILAIHEAQVKTYLHLTGLHTGLLFNFNTVVLINGIRRIERQPRSLPSLS